MCRERERETEREAALNAIKLQLLNMGKVLVKALNEKLMPFDLFMPGSLLTWEPIISILFFLSLVLVNWFSAIFVP